MERIALLVLALLAISWPVRAQDAVTRFTLMSAFDLDGEGVDVDQVIAATAIVDSGTSVADANWTILAQPDVCRLLDLTVVDTDMTAGTITVVGTDCLGYAKSCGFTFTAGDDTGVKTLTCTDSQGAYFASVTTVTTGVMTGESDETFALGYSTGTANGWAVYGTLTTPGPSGEHGVNPLGSYPVQRLITTSAACSNTVTGVSGAADAFESVAAGDLLLFTVRDAYGHSASYERKVTARASADSITVGGDCVIIPAAGVNFSFKKFFYSRNPKDRLWIPVSGYSAVAVGWSIDANADTGGVINSFQCLDSEGADAPENHWIEIATTTTASGGTQLPTYGTAINPYIVDLTKAPFSFCRFGLKFGTTDDADAAAEDINASVSLRK